MRCQNCQVDPKTGTHSKLDLCIDCLVLLVDGVAGSAGSSLEKQLMKLENENMELDEENTRLGAEVIRLKELLEKTQNVGLKKLNERMVYERDNLKAQLRALGAEVESEINQEPTK